MMSNPEIESTPVTRCLDQLGIPYRFFRHERGVQSLEQGAHEMGMQPEQIVRSILFRLSHGGFLMVLAPGERQISWQALRHHLDTSRISLATEAEVLEVTGYPLGAVSPYGTRLPIRVLADRGVFKPDEISIGSGVRHTSVILRRDDFRHSLGKFEEGDFSETGDQILSD